MLKIPLTTGAQAFSIQLGEKFCTFTLIYRNAKVGSAWYLDVYADNGELLLQGIPLVCGVNLLEQHAYRGLGKLTAKVGGMDNVTPSYADMGAELELYWEA